MSDDSDAPLTAVQRAVLAALYGWTHEPPEPVGDDDDDPLPQVPDYLLVGALHGTARAAEVARALLGLETLGLIERPRTWCFLSTDRRLPSGAVLSVRSERLAVAGGQSPGGAYRVTVTLDGKRIASHLRTDPARALPADGGNVSALTARGLARALRQRAGANDGGRMTRRQALDEFHARLGIRRDDWARLTREVAAGRLHPAPDGTFDRAEVLGRVAALLARRAGRARPAAASKRVRRRVCRDCGERKPIFNTAGGVDRCRTCFETWSIGP